MEWVLRHLRAYLLRSQESYSVLLEHLDRVRKVRGRICHGIDLRRHLHPLCRSIHFVDRVKEAARDDKQDHVGLL